MVLFPSLWTDLSSQSPMNIHKSDRNFSLLVISELEGTLWTHQTMSQPRFPYQVVKMSNASLWYNVCAISTINIVNDYLPVFKHSDIFSPETWLIPWCHSTLVQGCLWECWKCSRPHSGSVISAVLSLRWRLLGEGGRFSPFWEVLLIPEEMWTSHTQLLYSSVI